MKKILILLPVFIFSLSFSQGKLYIQNYSNYDLVMRVVAGNTNNCLPEVVTSMNFPANTQDVIDNFNDSAPYANDWSVRLSPTGNPLSQAVPSGLLTTVSNLTRWKFIWFHTAYPGTTNSTPDVDFNMADPSAFAACPLSGSDFIDGSLTDAFWFYIASENATYLIIQ
ncbi:hypothetical protein A0O34_21085 [Chryseobacterium glaciei]|uniref:Uncharacterized protein n=1 Tax=Chryseobacterium glaciei TaxID=1685010 RepID=A0A172Y0T7_9FLAO|nr:hypothetical protein [Chryseobacterium glaciei]ANF52859.1 hypothetical protein A0O34_21085 [Chryseobacterium glaciei]